MADYPIPTKRGDDWDGWWNRSRLCYRESVDDYPVSDKWWFSHCKRTDVPSMWELETRWRHRNGMSIRPRVGSARPNYFDDTNSLFEEKQCQPLQRPE
jgi:hypothetical protein